MEYLLNDFTISMDKSMLDIDLIHDYLSNTAYWAAGRSRDTVEKSLANLLCFGVYKGDEQVGFARVVTDFATFGWLCDVFIVEAYQGQGLGKWLVGCVISHPELRTLRYILLATRDAHELYRRYGEFELLEKPELWMARRFQDGLRP